MRKDDMLIFENYFREQSPTRELQKIEKEKGVDPYVPQYLEASLQHASSLANTLQGAMKAHRHDSGETKEWLDPEHTSTDELEQLLHMANEISQKLQRMSDYLKS